VAIAVALAFERQPKRADAELATGGRIRSDHRHGRQELDVHVQAACRADSWRHLVAAVGKSRATVAADAYGGPG
jgi:hypothetical protein